MGINISQGIPAGSEEEPWGHNVDPHKPAGLQSCKVRMLWFHPEAGTPVSHPHRCDPQGRSGSMNTGPSEQTHRDHAKRCGKASIRGAVPSEAMLQLPPQKKMLRGEAASTGATTQRARSHNAAGEGLRRANGTLSTRMEMETQPDSKPARLVGVVGEESQPGASHKHPPKQKLATAGRGRGRG